MYGKHSWYVSGSSNQNVTVAQLLSREVVEYIRNRKDGQNRGVCFSFWYKPDGNISSGEKNKAYAQIRIIYSNGSEYTETGDTVKPNTAEWWHGLVYSSKLETNTQTVKVRIVGMPYSGVGFKGWIDLALLSVYYYDTDIGNYGNATLTTNIYYSNAIPHPEFDGFVSLGFGIAAKAKQNETHTYSVAKLKDLTVELLPNNGTPTYQGATTQDGRLLILYLTQENSRNLTIRDLPLTYTYLGFDMSTLVSDLLWWGGGQTATTTTAILIMGKLPPLWPVAGTLIVSGLIAGAKSCFKIMRVSLEHPLAEGGSSYKVYETLDYSMHLSGEDDRIDNATATYYFDWRFQTTSDDVFAIKVSATVQWAKWTWDPLYQIYYWDYTTLYETKLSFVISIANYWQ